MSNHDKPGNTPPKVIIYEADGAVAKISVRLEGETVWLTNLQLAQLFQCTKSTVSEHIKNIFDSGELSADSVVRKFRTTATDGKSYTMSYYNLDMIISLGYRINAKAATRLRQWATVRLREYIIKGFTMDDDRLKELGGGGYWQELLERIRDIRTSEKVFWNGRRPSSLSRQEGLVPQPFPPCNVRGSGIVWCPIVNYSG